MSIITDSLIVILIYSILHQEHIHDLIVVVIEKKMINLVEAIDKYWQTDREPKEEIN